MSPMTLLRIDASIRTDGSVSRHLADTAVQAWQTEHPDGTVVRRDPGTQPLPADLWPVAVGAAHTPEDRRTPEQRAAVALVSELADELIGADAVVVATPLYNFGISQHLKVWLDLVLTDPRLGPPAQQAL